MSSPILSAKHISKYFGSGHTEVRAVDDVSIDIFPGELVLIMGPSGSGKTTLLSMLGGLLRPTQGTIEIEGVDITALKESQLPNIRALKIGFVFQTFNLLDALTVEENILFPAQLKSGDKQQSEQRGNNLIEQLGLKSRHDALPQTLSGGEKQRVAIARALINEPQIILADEPTGNLDPSSSREIMDLLWKINMRGTAVLMATHNYEIVRKYTARIIQLKDGKLNDVELRVRR